MFSTRIDLGLPLAVIELLARVGSIASITLLLLLFQAEILNPSEISRGDWSGLVFFPIGVIIGMVIAWWKEGAGAAITLGSLIAFYLVYGYFMKYHIAGWAFIVLRRRAFCSCCIGCSVVQNKGAHWDNRSGLSSNRILD